MTRSYWMEHKGKKIVFVDFSQTDIDGVKEAIAQATPIIAGEPKQSVLCLVETFGSKFSMEVSQAVKEFTMHNKPYIKMTAIVGVDGLQKVILNSVIVFTRRHNLVVKPSRPEALDFLASV
jgi:hypothetical protein